MLNEISFYYRENVEVHLSLDVEVVVLSDVQLLIIGLGILLPLHDDEGVPDVGVGQAEGGGHTPPVVELEVGGSPAEARHPVS